MISSPVGHTYGSVLTRTHVPRDYNPEMQGNCSEFALYGVYVLHYYRR
jgi:hypothetical protein